MKLMAFLFALIISSCALHESKDRDFNPALCEEALSYQAGFNDGREGRNMNSSYAFQCREDLKSGAMKGYKEGYDKGFPEYQKMVEEQRKQMAEMQKAQNQPSPTTIIIGGGGRGNYQKWYCEVEAFGKKYDGEAITQSEAKRNARQACERAGNHGMHCDQATCHSETASYNSRGWYCKLEVFTDTFEGRGITKQDATNAAKSSCFSKRQDSFFCKGDSVMCEENI